MRRIRNQEPDEDAPSDENASREKRNDWYSKRASMTHCGKRRSKKHTLNTLGERTGVRSTRESWYIAKMLFSYSFCFRYSFAS